MKRQLLNLGGDFINAKVHGMRSKLLEGERLSELAESGTLPELFRRTHPGRVFEGHLQFEGEITSDAVFQFDRILTHLSGKVFGLFRWLMTSYQLDNLKTAMRLYAAHGTRPEAEKLAIRVPDWLALPLERMFEAPDLARFVRAVPEPAFRRALESALAGESKGDLFALDTALDGAYIERLKELGSEADDRSRRLTGFDVDRRCLMMLLRARFNYQRPYEEVAPTLGPAGVFLTARVAQHIGEAADLKEAIRRIPNRALPEALHQESASLTQVEDMLLLSLYRLAARCYVEATLEPAVVTAFYYIKRIETANLIRVTESVRHSLPRAEIDAELLRLAQ